MPLKNNWPLKHEKGRIKNQFDLEYGKKKCVIAKV